MTEREYSGLISVIIPIYNVETYIHRCLDSVYRNTYKNLEIICVNDDSTDRSLDILNAQTDNRVVLIDKPNGGLSSARNAGLHVASGEYIAFVDSDDWIHSRYFEYLLRSIEQCDIGCSSFRKVYGWKEEENISYLPSQKFSEVEAEQIHDARDTAWGKLYRKHLLGNALFLEEVEMAEDRVFNLEVLSQPCCVAIVPMKLFFIIIDRGLYHMSMGRRFFLQQRRFFS